MNSYMNFNNKRFDIGNQGNLNLQRDLSFTLSNERQVVDLLNPRKGSTAQPRGLENREAVMDAFANFSKPGGAELLTATANEPNATSADVKAALAAKEATSVERDNQAIRMDEAAISNRVKGIAELKKNQEQLQREQFEYEKARTDRNDVISRNQYADSQYERMIDKINANNQSNAGIMGSPGTIGGFNGQMPPSFNQPQPESNSVFRMSPREMRDLQREDADRQFMLQDRLVFREQERQQRDYQRGIDEANRLLARQQMGLEQQMSQGVFARQESQSNRAFEQDIRSKAIQNRQASSMISPTIKGLQLDNAIKSQALESARMDLRRKRGGGF